VKRLVLAAIAAIGLHALLLPINMEWGKSEVLPTPSPLHLSLSYRAAELPQTPPPEPRAEPPKRPVPPSPAKPSEPKRAPVPERKPSPPKKKSPLKVQKEPARPVAPQAAPDQPPMAEAQVPSPPASARKEIPPVTDGSSLAGKPPSNDKQGTTKQAVPLYLKNPPPDYPLVARRRGYEGRVVLDVLVDREGRVRDLSVSQSSGHGVLDRAATKAVKDWLFEPARRGDETMDMWVEVPLTFRLK
jgi:protein TonB